GAPVLADPGVLAPADPRDPVVSALDQVRGGDLGAGGAVDVDPRVLRPEVVPGSAEGDERRLPLGEPGRLRVAEVGVGDDEAVDGGGPQQVAVPGQRVGGVAGEEQDVVARVAGGLDQRVDEPVHGGVGGALLGGADPHADQVGGAGAQVARGAVRRVA